MTDTSQKLPIEIKNRWDSSKVVFRSDTATTVAEAVAEAVKKSVSLYQADLSFVSFPFGARLDGASLVGARLDGASLVGARLVGATLAGGIKIHETSRVAYAGPVGDSDRTVFAFMAQADDKHPKPFLVFVCGCFTGDERAYRDRVQERYDDEKRHVETCIAALVHCKAVASTWPKPKAEKRPKAKKAAKG
jgi:hypothetical protein